MSSNIFFFANGRNQKQNWCTIRNILYILFHNLHTEILFVAYQVLPIHYFLQPIVDFQTKFLGGNILAIPGVDNVLDVRFICVINSRVKVAVLGDWGYWTQPYICWMQNIILTALADLLVWPNRLVIPILPGDYRLKHTLFSTFHWYLGILVLIWVSCL